ncbi:MAG: efflux RND transporter periplasmic adaptor subunit [Anaerolineales bacterium]
MKFKYISIAFLSLFVLAGCSGKPAPAPTPIFTPLAAPASSRSVGNVTASGIVVPHQEAHLGFATSGRVETVEITIGHEVRTGDLLIQLEGSEQLIAAETAANLELINAQHALDAVYRDADYTTAQALQAVHDARKAVRDAERRVRNFGYQAKPIDIEVAKANLAIARKALDKAKKDFKRFRNKPEHSLRRAAFLNKLDTAQKRYDAAERKYNQLIGVISNDFDLEQAQMELSVAQAQLEKAQSDYEILKEGPDPVVVEEAKARLENATAQVQAAGAAQGDIALVAPFDGTVVTIDVAPGDMVLPGQAVLVLSNLSKLHVETTDLSERDIDHVALGQKATVHVDALGGDLDGKVVNIAPRANTVGGDVVYTVYIQLDEPPQNLRWGMSVDVDIHTE